MACPPDKDLSAIQERQKLELEIKELKWKAKWWSQPITATVLGVLVGLGGFIVAAYQFESQTTNEQQRDRQSRVVDQHIRFQNQIRNDVDEILRFPRNQNETVSRVLFLIKDIETVMKSQDGEHQKVADLFPGYERRLTESLVFVVRDDCDFTKNLRDLEFATILVRYWDDYSAYLKEDADKLDYILYKYVQALEYLRKQNPGYFEDMVFDGKDYEVSPKYLGRKGEPILFSHFLDIKEGFELHLDILNKGTLSEDEKKRKESILRKFQAALCNRAISRDFLDTYFPDEPCTDVR
jgi:hypothetical protein